MPAAGALFVLLVVLSVAGTIGLWYAIDSETAAGETMSRDEAERTARMDTAENGAGEAPESHEEWGSDAAWGVDERERDDDVR